MSATRKARASASRQDAGAVKRRASRSNARSGECGGHARRRWAVAGIDVPVDPYRRHIFIANEPGNQPQPWPSSRIMVIDFDTTFYFHREGAGLLFGMGDPHETPTFDLTVQWDFLPQVIEVAVKRSAGRSRSGDSPRGPGCTK